MDESTVLRSFGTTFDYWLRIIVHKWDQRSPALATRSACVDERLVVISRKNRYA